MRHLVMAMLITLIGFDLSMAQTRDQEERESLRGIQGVAMVIEDIAPDAQADGLSHDAIRTAVELILSSNSIRVLTQSESNKTPGTPNLYVRVSIHKHSSDLYAYVITVEFMQKMSLAHRPHQMMLVTTWEEGSFGTISHSNIRQLINVVEERVKEFANDFLAVNPQ